MSVEASGGGASVGSSDRDGGNEWIGIRIDQNEESSDQRFSEQEKKQFDQNEESSDQRFSEQEKKQFSQIEESSDQRFSEQENEQFDQIEESIEQFDQIEESSDQRFSEQENEQFVSFEKATELVNKVYEKDDADPKIQKVPDNLRDNDKLKKYFEPKMFAFGPCSDYPDRTLEMAKQTKFNLAAFFLKQNHVKKEDLYKGIKEQINELKNCYSDDLTNDYKDKDHELAWMFLVDGCAILQFIYIYVDFWGIRDAHVRNLMLNNDTAVRIEQDLFLLENQLPYQLLQLIIQHTSKEDELLQSIYKFIFYCFRTPKEWHKNKDEILCKLKGGHGHVHLLALLRKTLILPLHKIDKKYDLIEIIEIIIDWTVYHFDKLKYNINESDRDRFPVPFRNIGKLSEAGINLKHSKTSCVGDISFRGGTLKLPPIIMEESTSRMIMNMLAYEMSPNLKDIPVVSTYMYILSKLIDQTEDVEKLREKNILLNQLGNDEEIVQLFNEISTHLNPNFEMYDKVKSNIDNYFDKKGLIWLHKVFHDIHQYFNGRWSLLAFIGALLAITSSIIQAVVTFLAYQSNLKKGI